MDLSGNCQCVGQASFGGIPSSESVLIHSKAKWFPPPFAVFVWKERLKAKCLSVLCRYTSTRAFLATLNEMNDYAGQHEVISENMTSLITTELTRYVQELKQERKSVINPFLFIIHKELLFKTAN